LTLDSLTQKRVNNATWLAAARQGTVAGINMAGGDFTYRHNFPMNAIQLFKVPVLVAGHCPEENDTQCLVKEGSGSYRKFFFRNGRLIGFILIGEISGAGFLLSLLKKQEIVSGKNLAPRPFPYQERLLPGWGYGHGSIFLRTSAERS
jgi:NADPH-dependent 2,4-dienoyl-CoA reductase/sulfur reductase-like enzyme